MKLFVIALLARSLLPSLPFSKSNQEKKAVLAKVNDVRSHDGAYSSGWGCNAQAHVPDRSGHQLSHNYVDAAGTTGDTDLSDQGEHLQHGSIFWEKQIWAPNMTLAGHVSRHKTADLRESALRSGGWLHWTWLCRTWEWVAANARPAAKWTHIPWCRWLLRRSSWGRCLHSGYCYWGRDHNRSWTGSSCRNTQKRGSTHHLLFIWPCCQHYLQQFGWELMRFYSLTIKIVHKHKHILKKTK